MEALCHILYVVLIISCVVSLPLWCHVLCGVWKQVVVCAMLIQQANIHTLHTYRSIGVLCYCGYVCVCIFSLYMCVHVHEEWLSLLNGQIRKKQQKEVL